VLLALVGGLADRRFVIVNLLGLMSAMLPARVRADLGDTVVGNDGVEIEVIFGFLFDV
jgi:hypothetical protein